MDFIESLGLVFVPGDRSSKEIVVIALAGELEAMGVIEVLRTFPL